MPKVLSACWKDTYLQDAMGDVFNETVQVETLTEMKSHYRPGDMLMFLGGGDIAAQMYGQKKTGFPSYQRGLSQRDKSEYQLMNYAIERGIPMFGICRGAQLLCIGAGGELIQDVNGHHGMHPITTREGENLTVNSAHHQMMRLKDTEHVLLAWTPHLSNKYEVDDIATTTPVNREIEMPKGEPEAAYFPVTRAVGVQWHPETSVSSLGSKLAVHFVRKYLLEERRA